MLLVIVTNVYTAWCPSSGLSGLVDDFVRASAEYNLSELLRVSQRLFLALVVRGFVSKEQL